MENKLFLTTILFITTLLSTVFVSTKNVSHSRHSVKIVHNELRIPATSTIKETRIKIAVIDTGIKVNKFNRKFLCATGHKSFIFGQRALEDSHGHGTNVASLIIPNMDNKKQCLLIIKFWDRNMGSSSGLELVRLALLHAERHKVSYINMSLTGTEPDHLEYLYLQRLLKKGVKLVIAAGNDSKNLDVTCQAYPGCYKFMSKNFRVVGSSHLGLRPLKRSIRVKGPKKSMKIRKIGKKWYEEYSYSNTGSRITHWENGTNRGTPQMTGTSQATAISTGKWVKEDSRGTH